MYTIVAQRGLLCPFGEETRVHDVYKRRTGSKLIYGCIPAKLEINLPVVHTLFSDLEVV